MASDTSLVFNIIAKDRASAVFAKVRAEAESTGKALALAFAPAAGPILAGATAGVIGLGGALAGAGAAAAVFKGVFSTSFKEVTDASKKTDDLRDKIKLLGEQARIAPTDDMRGKFLEQQAKAAVELQARLNLLPAPVRAATVAYGGMKDAWQGFVDKNKPQTFGIMASGFNLIIAAIPKLQPLFDVASNAAGGLLQKLHSFVSGGGFDKFVSFLATNGAAAFSQFQRIGENVVHVIGMLFSGFAKNGPALLKFFADASDKLATWADNGGLQKFIDYANGQGPGVGKLLLDIATAAANIAKATAPLAPLSMAVATALASLLAAVPPPVITAVVAAFVAFNVALKAYKVYTVAARAATLGAAAAQWIWKGAVVAMNFVSATAQIAAYLVKVAAVRVATLASAAAQAVWSAAVAAANYGAMVAQLAAYAIKQGAISVATKAWAAAQWLLNVAMSANPVTLIIIAIVALIAVFVLLWNKCDGFRAFWIAAWNLIKTAASAAWQWIKSAAVAVFNWFMSAAKAYISIYVGAWNAVKNGAATAWNWISSKVSSVFNTLKSGASKVGSILSGMWNGLKNGFRAAINLIVRGWNSLNFSIPGFSFAGMHVSGFSIGTPKLPYLAKGGDITAPGMAIVGERGPEVVGLGKGASVTPLDRRASRSRLELNVSGEREIVALFRRLIRTADLLQGA